MSLKRERAIETREYFSGKSVDENGPVKTALKGVRPGYVFDNTIDLYLTLNAPYPQEWTNNFRRLIRIRDGRKCLLCNRKGLLHVHHIDYNKNNLHPSNLITLCRNCHQETNTNRRAWYRMLYERIRRKYPLYPSKKKQLDT